MFSLEVMSSHQCSREKHQVCSFLFSYNYWALRNNITMAKKYTVQNCRKTKCENFLWGKSKLLSFLSSFETVVHML